MKPFAGRIFLFFSILLALPVEAACQNLSADQPRNLKFAAFPVLGYSPETRLLGGFSAQLIAGLDRSTHISSFGLSTLYTQNRQIILNLYPVLWWNENRNSFRGELELSRWPDKFFGIGNDNPWQNEESYESDRFGIYLEANHRIGNGSHYLGPVFHHQNIRITEYDEDPDALLPRDSIPGSSRSLRTGAGILWQIDSRDHNLFPRQGIYHQIKFIYYPDILGTNAAHLKTSIDLRKYIHFRGEHLLYLQAYGHFVSGTGIPFTHLSQMGGENRMRGYYYGRLRDRHLVMIQGQYITPFFLRKRIAFAGFAGFGQVFPEWGKIRFTGFYPSAGLGVRLMLFREQRFILRFDVAFGKNDHGMYGVIGEAI